MFVDMFVVYDMTLITWKSSPVGFNTTALGLGAYHGQGWTDETIRMDEVLRFANFGCDGSGFRRFYCVGVRTFYG